MGSRDQDADADTSAAVDACRQEVNTIAGVLRIEPPAVRLMSESGSDLPTFTKELPEEFPNGLIELPEEFLSFFRSDPLALRVAMAHETAHAYWHDHPDRETGFDEHDEAAADYTGAQILAALGEEMEASFEALARVVEWGGAYWGDATHLPEPTRRQLFVDAWARWLRTRTFTRGDLRLTAIGSDGVSRDFEIDIAGPTTSTEMQGELFEEATRRREWALEVWALRDDGFPDRSNHFFAKFREDASHGETRVVAVTHHDYEPVRGKGIAEALYEAVGCKRILPGSRRAVLVSGALSGSSARDDEDFITDAAIAVWGRLVERGLARRDPDRYRIICDPT